MKKDLMRFFCILAILLLAGCGNPAGEPEDGDGAAQDRMFENISADTVGEDGAGAAVSGNESQDTAGEIGVFELSNGYYAWVTTDISSDIAIAGVPEWIKIQDGNLEDSTRSSGMRITIPNVYGTITAIRVDDDNSKISIDYEDDKGESGQAVIPIDLYALEGDGIDPLYGWARYKYLAFDIEELTNETELPIEVWSETFLSSGKEYVAVYSRISPIYNIMSDFSPWMADYQFAILQGDETLYEIKLYQMGIAYEEIHFMEDVNGDGIEDFIQINNNNFYVERAVPYVFVWDQEQETCISGGPIAPDEKAEYESPDGLVGPIYTTVLYDRDTGIFYDANATERNAIYDHDIHGMVIMCGAKFADGEWKTVYEMYLGEEGEDYARETKYDEEGNVISEILYSEDDQYDVVNDIYAGCELSLCVFRPDYTKEEIVVNRQFSYSKYVRNEE